MSTERILTALRAQATEQGITDFEAATKTALADHEEGRRKATVDNCKRLRAQPKESTVQDPTLKMANDLLLRNCAASGH